MIEKNTDMSLSYKDCFLSMSAHKFLQKMGKKILSQMDGRHVGWINPAEQSQCNNIDFSIIKYSSNGSDNENNRCGKIIKKR